MISALSGTTKPYRVYTRRDIDQIPQLSRIGNDEFAAMKAVSAVLPFRVNNYVLENLIQWEDVPEDPIYQLTFRQEHMLEEQDFQQMLDLVHARASEKTVQFHAEKIQRRWFP